MLRWGPCSSALGENNSGSVFRSLYWWAHCLPACSISFPCCTLFPFSLRRNSFSISLPLSSIQVFPNMTQLQSSTRSLTLLVAQLGSLGQIYLPRFFLPSLPMPICSIWWLRTGLSAMKWTWGFLLLHWLVSAFKMCSVWTSFSAEFLNLDNFAVDAPVLQLVINSASWRGDLITLLQSGSKRSWSKCHFWVRRVAELSYGKLWIAGSTCRGNHLDGKPGRRQGTKSHHEAEVRGEMRLCLALALGPSLDDVSPHLLYPFFQFLCVDLPRWSK